MGLHRLLSTCAAGDIGTALRSNDQLRVGDLVPINSLWEGGESVIADIRDLSAMEEAASGMDAIVPLAGHREGTIPRDQCFEVNMGGTYHVLEAARCQGVRWVVFASSNHVTGFYEQEGEFTRPNMPLARTVFTV